MAKSNIEELSRLRHSAAHILAQAVQKLFPGTKLAIGPVIKDGFYYDFERAEAFTDEDLVRLETEMKKIVSEAQEFKKYAVPREKAIGFFTERQEPYKLEIIAGLQDEEITFVENGPFTDLCEGNHLNSTKDLAAFKLLSVAGAYWRGDEHNKMLQRIYGTAFFSKDELETYLHRLEEAKKRDHRKLGKQLDLFSFHIEAPGMPFYHPRGLRLYQNLVGFWQEEHRKEGYLEIKTPVMLKDELWKQSGHYAHYQENMFFSKVEEGTYAVRPMNCPGGTLVYRSAQRSYRDLPLRMAELGLVHRRERSGVLHGLFRVNAFTIDDAHIFCTEDQIESEISRCIALILRIYKTFGFQEINIGLSTRPDESMGSDEVWNKATDALKSALERNQIEYVVHEGGGAFYGPKIDFEITDSIGREWQCGTIQLDFQMPERFNLEYISPDNTQRRPVMVHRAVFGSIERFYGILVEHYAGAFPVWLAPVKVRVLSISEKHAEYAQKVVNSLNEKGILAEGDLSPEKVGYKIRNAEMMKIPYVFVVGEKEIAANQVAVRKHGGKDLGVQSLETMTAQIQQDISNKL
jgi:threonyl-tRNA synthetase